MKYIIETFPSVVSYCNELENRACVDGMYKKSERAGSSWAGTESYKEANELALYGDKESASKVEASAKKLRLSSRYENRAQSRTVRSVIGQRPCVPAAVQGHPCSMYRKYKVYTKKPVITILYNMSASGGNSVTDIVDAGAKLAESIQNIERSGVRVNLYAGVTAESDNRKERTATFVKIKDSSKDFDLLRMAYTLINPSFLRRHWFKWLESRNDITPYQWNSSYGHTIQENASSLEKEIQKQLPFDKMITYTQIKNLSVEQIEKEFKS